jgi:UDP-N-acetylmuramoyl-L-alanyl-D-glutamate--2,6-diaminopimelate ligase
LKGNDIMVRLSDLLKYLKSIEFDFEVRIPAEKKDSSILLQDVFSDSRQVTPGSVFCCVKGKNVDGHDLVDEVMGSGCEAIVCEKWLDHISLPQIKVDSVRQVMGFIASFVHHEPSKKLKMIAVTGTNGKSTTTYMIRSLLQNTGIKTGMLGTIVYCDGNNESEAGRTTPESCDVQRFLADMVHNGCHACVMEASSHGLSQGRLNGCLFDNAVFTNITPEHLDYHGDLEHYFEAKKLLFSSYMKSDWKGAVNVDDSYGRRLKNEFPGKITGYGLVSKTDNVITADHLEMSLEGLAFSLILPDNRIIPDIRIPLTGKYNVYNALAAVGGTLSLGICTADMRDAFAKMPQVPGRLEKYMFSNGVCCVIDYAHTPDALQNVLIALKEVSSGRLLLVFGHGGNRFRELRPAIGRIAAEFADHVTVTMDNPRDEDPLDIALQIEEGILSSDRPVSYEIIIDREQAVISAMDKAGANDIVLVTGKGPEQWIIWGKEKIAYNDTSTVKNWARSRNLEWC